NPDGFWFVCEQQIMQPLLDLVSNPVSSFYSLSGVLPPLNNFAIGLSRDELEFGPADFNPEVAHPKYSGSFPVFHLMFQPMIGYWSAATGVPARTASMAPRKSLPVARIYFTVR